MTEQKPSGAGFPLSSPHAAPLAMEIHQTSALWLHGSFLNTLWAQLLTAGHLNLIYKWRVKKETRGMSRVSEYILDHCGQTLWSGCCSNTKWTTTACIRVNKYIFVKGYSVIRGQTHVEVFSASIKCLKGN